jgi:hypothetical protein
MKFGRTLTLLYVTGARILRADTDLGKTIDLFSNNSPVELTVN